MKKVAVFLGDFFWSSIPYDGIPLYNLLNKHFETDLIMFSNDIRLNKQVKRPGFKPKGLLFLIVQLPHGI